MAINETISKGNKYRRLKDAANKVWQRISFWTAASDVEFDNGTTLQNSLGSVTGITDSLTSTSSTVAASAAAVASLNSKITSFQAGVNTLYNKFVSLGVTPSDKTLAAMTNAVQSVYNTGFNAGYLNLSGMTYCMWQSAWDSTYYDRSALDIIKSNNMSCTSQSCVVPTGRYMIIFSNGTRSLGWGIDGIAMTEVLTNNAGAFHVCSATVTVVSSAIAWVNGFSGGREPNSTVLLIRLGNV